MVGVTKPPSEAACQDVFLVKNFIVNAIGEQVRTPAEICSGMHYRLASPLPVAVRMCFLLTRQPNRASCGCVLVQVSFEERRGSTHSLECIAHSKVRCISSEAAPNRSALAGIIINKNDKIGVRGRLVWDKS